MRWVRQKCTTYCVHVANPNFWCPVLLPRVVTVVSASTGGCKMVAGRLAGVTNRVYLASMNWLRDGPLVSFQPLIQFYVFTTYLDPPEDPQVLYFTIHSYAFMIFNNTRSTDPRSYLNKMAVDPTMAKANGPRSTDPRSREYKVLRAKSGSWLGVCSWR